MAPQGTILAPFLFYTSDFRYNTSYCLQKLSDDRNGYISDDRNGPEEEYRKLLKDFVDWCKMNPP